MKKLALFLPDNWLDNEVYSLIVISLQINFPGDLLIVKDSDFSCDWFDKNEPQILIDCDSKKGHIPFCELEKIYKKSQSQKMLVTFDDEYLFTETLASSYLYDVILSTDFISVIRMKQYGIKSKHWINPVEISNQISIGTKKKYLLSFVGRIGGMKSTRKKYIDLLKNEFDEKSMWLPSDSNKLVSKSEMFNVMRNSEINLNFSEVSNVSLFKNESEFNFLKTGMKGRPFEIGGQGGFCLSQYSVSLNRFLKNNFHVGYFLNEDDFIRKIKFYLKNESMRNIMASNLHNKTKEICGISSPSNILIREIYSLINTKPKIKEKYRLRNDNFLIYRYQFENLNHKTQKTIKYSNIFREVQIETITFIKSFSSVCRLLFGLIKNLFRGFKYFLIF